MSEGGRGFEVRSLEEIDPFEEQEKREHEIRTSVWKLSWIEEGWREQDQHIFPEVLLDQHGHLSGTTRLVLGPLLQVAQIYFEPGDKPRVVAFYERLEDQQMDRPQSGTQKARQTIHEEWRAKRKAKGLD